MGSKLTNRLALGRRLQSGQQQFQLDEDRKDCHLPHVNSTY
jgi:hypothetical protein